MSQNIKSVVLRAHEDESGQTIALVAFALIVLMGFIGLVIDMGRVYYSYRLLKTSTNAAALAGAQALPNSAAAQKQAKLYSGVSNNKNAYPNLPGVQMASPPTVLCLSSVGLSCLDSTGDVVSSGGANAIQVTQTVSVPMTFLALVGAQPITLTATATATMKGASRAPYNVAVVIDSTSSMSSNDSDSVNTACTGHSKEYCATLGVAYLLGQTGLDPCGWGQTCGGSQSSAVDEVSLFTFPAVSTATVSKDYSSPCSGSPTSEPYPLPALPASGASAPFTTTLSDTVGTSTVPVTYQVVGFSDNYRTSDGSSTLNTGSQLVAATGNLVENSNGTATYTQGCMQVTGMEGTYYPAAIYSAAEWLLDNQNTRGSTNGLPTTQNALIILGDGDAPGDATNQKFGSTVGTGTTYPSSKNQCQQAVAAAQWAQSEGITIYSVAYDASTSGCSTDVSPYNNPCYTMQQLARLGSSANSVQTTAASSLFFTSNSSCEPKSGGNQVMSLNSIFTAIANNLSLARLVPNNTQ
jgi:hypothetical protein